LALVEVQWRFSVGKVAAGLAESRPDGSLPLADDLKSHLQADCLYIGISSGLNAMFGNKYGRTLPFNFYASEVNE